MIFDMRRRSFVVAIIVCYKMMSMIKVVVVIIIIIIIIEVVFVVIGPLEVVELFFTSVFILKLIKMSDV